MYLRLQILVVTDNASPHRILVLNVEMTVNAILVSAVDRIRAASMNAQRIVAENSAVMILNATLENAVMNFQESAPRISHSVVDSAQMIQDAIRVQVNVVEIISV